MVVTEDATLHHICKKGMGYAWRRYEGLADAHRSLFVELPSPPSTTSPFLHFHSTHLVRRYMHRLSKHLNILKVLLLCITVIISVDGW